MKKSPSKSVNRTPAKPAKGKKSRDNPRHCMDLGKLSFRSAYEKIEMAMQNTKIDLALKELQWHHALLSTVKRWAHFIDTDPTWSSKTNKHCKVTWEQESVFCGVLLAFANHNCAKTQ